MVVRCGQEKEMPWLSMCNTVSEFLDEEKWDCQLMRFPSLRHWVMSLVEVVIKE
jgi:hypothetical protein